MTNPVSEFIRGVRKKSQDPQLMNDLHDFICCYFNTEEIRDLSFRLGINFENLPGDTLSRVARDLIIAVGEAPDENDCQARYLALLDVLERERGMFYDQLYENLDPSSVGVDSPEEALARAYCVQLPAFVASTKTIIELTLGRVGLENRVTSVTIILILLTFALLAYLLYERVRPDQMAGDFNIAVAPFYVEGAEAEIGEDVANSIYGRLQANFRESLVPIVDVWGPNEPVLNPVPIVSGTTVPELDAGAARLADKINADIVVYGTVLKHDSQWAVLPKFYISPNNFENASEILGPYDLGEQIELAEGRRRAVRVTVGDKLTPRAEFLTQVAIALTYYSIANYERAADILRDVLPVGQPDLQASDDSLRLVYIILGNTFLRRAQQLDPTDVENESDAAELEGQIMQLLSAARSNFEQSKTLDPHYARAFLGLGDAAYLLSWKCDNQRCVPDDALLQEAGDYYRQALRAENAPQEAVIEAKAYFGLGQVAYLQSYIMGDGDYSRAIEQFELVLDEYDGGKNPRAIDLAAEAQARLGLIYCNQGEYEAARRAYSDAIDMHASDGFDGLNRIFPKELREKRIAMFRGNVAALENPVNIKCGAGSQTSGASQD